MNRDIEVLLKRWYNLLGLSQQSRRWYRDRIREELQERRQATTRLRKLSETSDVFFSISRARHDGFPCRSLPPFAATRHGLVYVYMLAKFSSRWGFYRTAAWLCDAPSREAVCEVVNPGKDENLWEVALRHSIDPGRFVRVGGWLRWLWPLLH